MDRILPIIAGTPLWVWPLLAALLWLGWRAGQTRTVSLRRLAVLPLAITALSAATLIASQPSPPLVLTWILGMAAGAGLGWLSFKEDGLQVDRDHGLLRFAGEWKTLGLIVMIFVFRYYWGYKSATEPELVALQGVAMSYLGFIGMLAGIFIGWRLRSVHLYRTAPSTDLRENS